MSLNGDRIWLQARCVLHPSQPVVIAGARGVPLASLRWDKSPVARLRSAWRLFEPRSVSESIDVGAPLVCAPALTEF